MKEAAAMADATACDPIRVGDRWVFPSGRVLPVIAGGADDGDPPPAGEGDPPAKGEDQLGEAGKRALAREREARREAEQKMKQLEARLAELDEADKSEVQKLTDRLAAAERARDEAVAAQMRLEVATAKGLTQAQAKRLSGSTREELEADADELLEAFGGASDGDGDPPPPKRQPSPDLTPGAPGAPDPEPDIDKVLEKIPRL